MSTHSFTPASDVLSPLLSVNEVADLLGISRPTVYALIHRGELVPIRVGERLRFEPADVRAYLERNREIIPGMREPDLRRAQDSRDNNCDEDGTSAA
jgi:excisionase family DNA binding protein